MAESKRKRRSCSNNEAVQKKAHSGGNKDKVKVYKILRQKDEVNKLHTTHDLQVSWS